MVRPAHEARGFLEAFFAEVAERFLRLKAFTEKQKQAIPLEGGKRFAFFLSKQIDVELDKILTYFRRFKNITELSADEEENFFMQLQRFWREFEILHAGLHWLHTPWVGAEIYAFVEGIFRGENQKELEELYAKLNGTLIFTDIYNFFRYEPFRHLPGINEEEKPVVWLLPKADGDNPLAWPMISHEVAHDIISYYNIDDALRMLLPNASNLELRKAIELAADLIAIRFLGPAYLFSFMNIAMFPVRENLRLSQDEHPSPNFRVEYMKEELKGKEIDLDRVEVRYSPSDEPFLPAKIYLDLFKQRLSLDTRVYHCDDQRLMRKIEDEERDLGEKVRQALSLAEVTPREEKLLLPQFDLEKCIRSVGLAKRLRRNVLVGSFKDEGRDEEIRAAIESKGENIGRGQGQFRMFLKKLNEEPSYVSEILNAGWFEKLFRLSYSPWLIKLAEGSGILINGYKGMDEQCADPVSDLDHMLEKSIEASTVHLFFDRGFRELELEEK